MTHAHDPRPAPASRTLGRESLHVELDRALRALSLVQAADLCLKAGDDLALELLGFSREHIAQLRASSRGARAGYPLYAIRQLKATIRLLRSELAKLPMEALA